MSSERKENVMVFGRLMPFVSLGFCSISSIAIVIFRAFSSGVGTI